VGFVKLCLHFLYRFQILLLMKLTGSQV
jgi:hypothetical protein